MRDSARIHRVLEKVERLWQRFPDWRLGQLVANMTNSDERLVFYLEDDVLEKELDRWPNES